MGYEEGQVEGGGSPAVQQDQGGASFFYPLDVINHPYPFTPKFVWRAMFSGIQERIESERHAIGVGGHAVQELAYFREATRDPFRIRHDVGRVIDTGRHYVGAGWTRLDTVRGVVWVYNPRLDAWASGMAPANKAITQEVERSLDIELGREAPGYYDANGFMVAKGDPSAVRLVGKSRGYRR